VTICTGGEQPETIRVTGRTTPMPEGQTVGGLSEPGQPTTPIPLPEGGHFRVRPHRPGPIPPSTEALSVPADHHRYTPEAIRQILPGKGTVGYLKGEVRAIHHTMQVFILLQIRIDMYHKIQPYGTTDPLGHPLPDIPTGNHNGQTLFIPTGRPLNQGCRPGLPVREVLTGNQKRHRDLQFHEVLPDSRESHPEVIAPAAEILPFHTEAVAARAAGVHMFQAEVAAARTIEVQKQPRRAVIPDHLQAAVHGAGS
jgi:hypothetical protein